MLPSGVCLPQITIFFQPGVQSGPLTFTLALEREAGLSLLESQAGFLFRRTITDSKNAVNELDYSNHFTVLYILKLYNFYLKKIQSLHP